MKNRIPNPLDLSGSFKSDVSSQKVLTATFKLTEVEMLEAMKHKHVKINGKIYETPKQQLKDYFMNNQSGILLLELVEYKEQNLKLD